MTKDEFNTLLKKANLTKKEFAKVSQVPYNTIKMWGIDRNIPSWVKPFIENYIKAKIIDDIKEKVCPVKGDNE